MKDIRDIYKQARRTATPLLCIASPDAEATIKLLMACEKEHVPVIEWNCVQGFSPMNTAGMQEVARVQSEDMIVTDADQALTAALKFAEESVCFFHNAVAMMNLPEMNGVIVQQAVWNLRDPYKMTRRCAVLLGNDARIPSYLEGDVLVIDEPLPDAEQLKQIVLNSLSAMQQAKADYPMPDAETLDHAVDAIRGLSAFPAEQATALSLKKQGLDIDAMWDRKREKIRQTPGLAVFNGSESFATIGGCENIKSYMSRLLNGREPYRMIVFVDEIEKAMAGAQGDTSGVSQEMHGTLLSWMADNRIDGVLFLGVPGTAKSAIAKASGNEAKIPVITFDLSGMKASLVGESGANLRRALKVVDAVSDRRPLVVATCNDVNALSPELLRRFKKGKFFFDLPTQEERASIWKIYQTKYEIADMPTFSDEGWTGAEIEECADRAYDVEMTLDEAAEYVVPMSVSSRARIERLRQEAAGKYISASYKGVFQYAGASQGKSGLSNSIMRQFETEEE